MLKWAVNQPRPSYLDAQPAHGQAQADVVVQHLDCPSSASTPHATPLLTGQRHKLRRHSLLMLPSSGKENQLTSTPLPLPLTLPATPHHLHHHPLLRDLSNIMSPPTATATPTRRRVYASTLPTFEAEAESEFSPSYRTTHRATGESNSIIPGPLLALRGMGIPDSYFEKPRYLHHQQQQQQDEQEKALPKIADPAPAPAAVADVEATLSSSQMGDVTLERMIDAILQSTRKPDEQRGGLRNRSRSRAMRQRLRQRHQHQHQQQQRLISSSSSTSATHSPTYRPAFDPASDLCEYWQTSPLASTLSTGTATGSGSGNGNGYEEREVRSPQGKQGRPLGQLHVQLQLRRQRVVRRKRKITTKISSSVRQSAQKLLAAASRSAQKMPRSTQRHISPDSGHNSTSDCELEEDEEGVLHGGTGLGDESMENASKLDIIWMQTEPRDATKRRLSFSLNDDS